MEGGKETLVKIAEFIIYPEITGFLLYFKIFCLIFFFGALLWIIWLILIRIDWLNWLIIWDAKEFFTMRPYGLKKVTKEWLEIKKKLESDKEEDWKTAVIEADSLLHRCLIKLKVGTDSLEETLEKVIGKETMENIEEVKKAHQIRNQIVREPEFRLSREEAKKILEIYEKALKEIVML